MSIVSVSTASNPASKTKDQLGAEFVANVKKMIETEGKHRVQFNAVMQNAIFDAGTRVYRDQQGRAMVVQEGLTPEEKIQFLNAEGIGAAVFAASAEDQALTKKYVAGIQFGSHPNKANYDIAIVSGDVVITKKSA